MAATSDQKVSHQELLDDYLYPWQRDYVFGGHRFIVVKKGRNVGLTTAGLIHAILQCAAHSDHTYFLVTTKVEKAEDELLAPLKHKLLPVLRETDIGGLLPDPQMEYARKVKFPNNSEIKAASNDVEKLRGPTTASYMFDECASWDIRQHEALREAVFPIVRDDKFNPNGSLRMISTPKPARNLYREIWERQDPEDKWHRLDIDIYDASDCDQFPHDDPSKFREACETEDEFLQEYGGVFLDVEGNYFDRNELQQLDDCPDHVEGSDYRIYAGVDIGRKHDLTATVFLWRWGYDGKEWAWTKTVQVMDGVPFRIQKPIICASLLKAGVDGACIDQTKHPALVEEIEEFFARDEGLVDFFDPDEEWLRGHLEGVDSEFTGEAVIGLEGNRKRKADNTRQLQSYIEAETLSLFPCEVMTWGERGWVDGNPNKLINDLARVEESTTASGKLRYDAPRSKKEGHADSYSALELAMAAEDETAPTYLGSF